MKAVCIVTNDKCSAEPKLRKGLCNKHYLRVKKYNSTRLPTKKSNKSHPLYVRWKNMRARVYNKNHPRYLDWGGRGIKIYKDWDNFQNYADYIMALPNSLQEGYTLDRIDNNSDYTPGNMRWATITQQNANQRLRKDNTSGIKNVYKITNKNQWLVCVQRDKVTIVRQLFSTKKDAIKFRESLCI